MRYIVTYTEKGETHLWAVNAKDADDAERQFWNAHFGDHELISIEHRPAVKEVYSFI